MKYENSKTVKLSDLNLKKDPRDHSLESIDIELSRANTHVTSVT